jgi:hypothetical protein
MANDFNKEERVAFEQILEGFQDAEVMSKNVSKYATDQQQMERSGDTIWRPQPYIMNSFSGQDQSSNFNDKAQLSVPASINIERSVPWIMTATELRDALQEQRLGDGARQKLASDINVSILNTASMEGTLIVKQTAAASGFADVALCEAIMNEQGVPDYDRILALSTRDYNGMAADLASRETLNKKPIAAYERAYVGRIASFDTWKLDYAKAIAAESVGSLTMSTLDAATANYYVPTALQGTPTTSERVNRDNRYHTITVSATTDVAVGDCFTIAGMYAVHAITKESTGQLKTFRVMEVTDATHLKISPPIISAVGGSEAEVQYQNCSNVTKSGTAALVWLNTVAGKINPFWQKDAMEILPGRYAVPENAGASVLRGSTDSGLELVMTKQFDIDTLKTKFRIDTRYGVVCKAPEMAGIILFSQT